MALSGANAKAIPKLLRVGPVISTFLFKKGGFSVRVFGVALREQRCVLEKKGALSVSEWGKLRHDELETCAHVLLGCVLGHVRGSVSHAFYDDVRVGSRGTTNGRMKRPPLPKWWHSWKKSGLWITLLW